MSYPYTPVPEGPPPKETATQFALLAGSDRIHYLRSYQYIFENPNWTMNVLWGFLCILSTGVIPIIGQLVFMGYQFEIVESLCQTRGARYIDFDVNRFVDYLKRGIWPFLAQLVISLVLIPVMFVFVFGGIFLIGAIAAAAGDDAGGITMVVLIPLLVITIVVLQMLLVMFSMPFMLRAGLTQDFGQAMNFAWARDFVGKVWVEIVLASLFLAATALMSVILGGLVLCVGMYAAVAIVSMAWAHLMYQLYGLYLARGGEPILLKANVPPSSPMPLR